MIMMIASCSHLIWGTAEVFIVRFCERCTILDYLTDANDSKVHRRHDSISQ